MQSAEELKNAGNKFFKEKDYEAAIKQYNLAISADPNFAVAWCNKGSAHMCLHQYAEALDALDKALAIKPNYENAKSRKQEILQWAFTRDVSQLVGQYTEAMFRPIVCETGYLKELGVLRQVMNQIRKAPILEQVSHILKLIEFLVKYFDFSKVPHSFIKPELSAANEAGRRLRLHEIGNVVVKSYPVPPDFSQKADAMALKMLDVVGKDIFLEDAKIILRMLFETMYYFPREVRGKLIEVLPWGENSWYLFDYCAAIFVKDDATDIETKRGGISLAPYGFNGDVAKQRSIALYQLSLMRHTTIVKIAILDILKDEIFKLQEFFEYYFSCLTNNQTVTADHKMAELPNLRSLLWYSKQVFNTQRMMCFLPAVPGNNLQNIDGNVITDLGITSALNTSAQVDLVKLIEMQGFESTVSEEQKLFILFGAKILQDSGCLGTVQNLINAKAMTATVNSITYGMEAPKVGDKRKFKTADVIIGEDGQPVTPAKRMLLTSGNNYLNPRLLKGRLGLLRKLQLGGDVFNHINWGNHVKRVEFVSSDMLWAIRCGLTHIEDKGYFSLISAVERDENQIKKLFRELQTLKEDMYEVIAQRQTNFPAWPSEKHWGNEFSEWSGFASVYWAAVKKFFNVEKPDYSVWVPKENLLTAGEVKIICDAVELIHLPRVTSMLEGKMVFCETAEFLKMLKKNVDKKTTQKVRKTFEKAEKKFRELRKVVIKNENAKNTQDKAKIKEAIKSNMAKNYPTIEALGLQCWEAEKKPATDKATVFAILKDRLQLLQMLLTESEILVTDKATTQKKIFELIQRDMALLLSLSYVLGHTVNAVNKLAGIIEIQQVHSELVARLPHYISLRNHLEHTDPIIESLDLPLYQMYSEAPRMMAVVIAELLCDFKAAIMQFDIANPALKLAVGDQEYTKQSYALDLAAYQFPDSSEDGVAFDFDSSESELPTEPEFFYGELNGEQITFEHHKTLGDGQCGIHALPIPNAQQLYAMLTDVLMNPNHPHHAICINTLGEDIVQLATDNQLNSQNADLLAVIKLAADYLASPTQTNLNDLRAKCLTPGICLAYINGDLKQKNWISVGVIKSWAIVTDAKLRIWQIQDKKLRKINVRAQHDAQSPDVHEILYINGNHFDLLTRASQNQSTKTSVATYSSAQRMSKGRLFSDSSSSSSDDDDELAVSPKSKI